MYFCFSRGSSPRKYCTFVQQIKFFFKLFKFTAIVCENAFVNSLVNVISSGYFYFFKFLKFLFELKEFFNSIFTIYLQLLKFLKVSQDFSRYRIPTGNPYRCRELSVLKKLLNFQIRLLHIQVYVHRKVPLVILSKIILKKI